MSPVVERITEGAELAEGPHWDPATKSLYYVDIFGKTIHRYVPSTKKHTQATLGKFMYQYYLYLSKNINFDCVFNTRFL